MFALKAKKLNDVSYMKTKYASRIHVININLLRKNLLCGCIHRHPQTARVHGYAWGKKGSPLLRPPSLGLLPKLNGSQVSPNFYTRVLIFFEVPILFGGSNLRGISAAFRNIAKTI